jgi:hypothetical protein
VGTVYFPAVKWPGHGANHTLPPGIEIVLPLPPLSVCIGMSWDDLYLDAQVVMSASISAQSTLHSAKHQTNYYHIHIYFRCNTVINMFIINYAQKSSRYLLLYTKLG